MTKIGKSAFLVALSAALCASAKTVFLETEAFEDWGGWVNDTQFMDQMGSPYLLAHGLGKPVADAKTHFVLYGRESGVYAVWVRTKNWVAHVYTNQGKTPPTASAGTFQVVVNGKAMPMTLGTQGGGEWLWVNAGEVALGPGANVVALHDLDGFDGRVDAAADVQHPDFA